MNTPFIFSGNAAFGIPAGTLCNGRMSNAHKVPRMPIMIDQSRADPMDVRDLRGQPLHTVLDDDGLNGKMLQIFTSKDKAEDYLKDVLSGKLTSRRAKRAADAIPPGTGYLELYEHIDFGGCSWRLLEANIGNQVNDYSTLISCGFLWWGWRNANNMISSADIIVGRAAVVFYDDINLAGSSFAVPGEAWIPNLVDHGWNDRFSSHLFFPAI